MEQKKPPTVVLTLQHDLIQSRCYLLSIILFHYPVFHQCRILHYLEAYLRSLASHSLKFTLHCSIWDYSCSHTEDFEIDCSTTDLLLSSVT